MKLLVIIIHCKNEIGILESRGGSKVDSNIKFGFMIGWFGFIHTLDDVRGLLTSTKYTKLVMIMKQN